ncbi:MAG: hypothetical protein PHU03_08600 [Syntrophales bacterium]|nr:hypothetical protein [Syntrophales bacterium]
MAKSRHSFQKRQRELSQKKKQQDKADRKSEARLRKKEADYSPGNHDPDIDGITPGPQPLPEQWDDADNNDDAS